MDQQVRSVDIGKVNIGIGMVTRGKLAPGQGGAEAVAEHDQVSEVYHVIDGSATLLTGPDLVDPEEAAVGHDVDRTRAERAGLLRLQVDQQSGDARNCTLWAT